MSDQRSWESGTWEGARRAGIRKALRLSVRERLQALDSLAETSERLAQISVGKRRDDCAGEERGGDGAKVGSNGRGRLSPST